MSVGSAYEGANVDEPQELLNIARHHCQAIQTIIDQQSTNHPIGCPKNSISRLSVDQPHNSNKRLLLRGPNRQPPFGSRLTLSDRFYTPTLIRPDNEREGWIMSHKSICVAAPLANAQPDLSFRCSSGVGATAAANHDGGR
jgi:hypothetical protein